MGEITQISGDNPAEAEDLLGEDSGNLPGPVLSPTKTVLCVNCSSAPGYLNGPNSFPTCGTACASELQDASGLSKPKKSRTPDPPNSAFTSSAPPNLFDNNWESRTSGLSNSAFTSSAPPNTWESRTSGPSSSAFKSAAPPFDNNWLSRPSERTYADTARSHSRPNQMCEVCHVRPRCQRGGKIYPTCGLSCAAKLHTSGSVEICDFCKKRPKAVMNGKMYPQCGKTCRDKAKLAETAANAAVCISCILCWRSTKAGESDFCSEACENLADMRAPFLIEIPRGHIAFKIVAEFFTSECQTSKTHCPTIKRVYMVVVKKSFVTSFEKYRTKIGSQSGILQRKRTPSKRWLVLSRECGFGDPGDLEPCSSNKCLLCSIIRSSFNRSNFPKGITTSKLNRTIELYQSGKKSSSKIAVLANVVVGREAVVSPRDVQDLQVVQTLPPQSTDSVHVIGVRKDGSRVDWGDNVVYDGHAVRPMYLISYE